MQNPKWKIRKWKTKFWLTENLLCTCGHHSHSLRKNGENLRNDDVKTRGYNASEHVFAICVQNQNYTLPSVLTSFCAPAFKLHRRSFTSSEEFCFWFLLKNLFKNHALQNRSKGLWPQRKGKEGGFLLSSFLEWRLGIELIWIWRLIVNVFLVIEIYWVITITAECRWKYLDLKVHWCETSLNWKYVDKRLLAAFKMLLLVHR